MISVLRGAIFFFGLAQLVVSDDITYVEWDTGMGGIALKTLNKLIDPEFTNKMIDEAGLGDMTKDVNFHLIPLSFKGHSITPSLDTVHFSGLDTVNNLEGINVNGHYNLTSGGSLDGLKWGANFSNIVTNGNDTNTYPFVLKGGMSGVSFDSDLEVLADASKMHLTSILSAIVDVRLNKIELEIQALDNVYVEYVDDSEIGKMITDQVVKMANNVLLPEITKAANAAATEVIEKFLAKKFHH